MGGGDRVEGLVVPACPHTLSGSELLVLGCEWSLAPGLLGGTWGAPSLGVTAAGTHGSCCWGLGDPRAFCCCTGHP